MVIVTIGKWASWNNVGRAPENVLVLKYRSSLLGAERDHEKNYEFILLSTAEYGRIKISNFFTKGWNSFVGRTHNVHSNHRKKYYIGKVLVGRTHNVYSNHCKKH